MIYLFFPNSFLQLFLGPEVEFEANVGLVVASCPPMTAAGSLKPCAPQWTQMRAQISLRKEAEAVVTGIYFLVFSFSIPKQWPNAAAESREGSLLGAFTLRHPLPWSSSPCSPLSKYLRRVKLRYASPNGPTKWKHVTLEGQHIIALSSIMQQLFIDHLLHLIRFLLSSEILW